MEMKDILKTMRLTNKITQSELARQLGIGQATVCQWERGTAKPTCDALVALSKFYSVSADFLLGINENMHGSEIGDVYDELIGKYDNLTHQQKHLIIEIMDQMKAL